jgi:hypothetical protein
MRSAKIHAGLVRLKITYDDGSAKAGHYVLSKALKRALYGSGGPTGRVGT